MPKVPIIMPQLGESIAEATIVRFCVEVGDAVETDQEIIEVETNKAVMGVTTPCTGRIESFSASVNEAYPIGTVLGYVEASVEDAERLNAAGAGPIAERAAQIEPEPVSFESNEGARGISVPIRSEGGPFVSPRVRARIDDLGWSPPEIGFAVEVEDGIIVPVIRNLDQQPISKLGKVYQDLVSAARTRRLPEEAREGSIASVTNFGPLGITWATPIPLPTETLIVGLGRGEKRPVWDEVQGQFKPILMAELTVTFDHRIMDGGASGRLIQRMMTLLADPENL